MTHREETELRRKNIVLVRQSQSALHVRCSIWASDSKRWRVCPRGLSHWVYMVRIWWQWRTNAQGRKNWEVNDRKRRVCRPILVNADSDRIHTSLGCCCWCIFWQVFNRISWVQKFQWSVPQWHCLLSERREKRKKAGGENVSAVLQYNVRTLLS